MGLISDDQRQPGSYVIRPTTLSSISTMSMWPCGNRRTSVASLNRRRCSRILRSSSAWLGSGSPQKREQGLVQPLGLLPAHTVAGAGGDHRLGTRNPTGEVADDVGCGELIVLAGDQQHRTGDLCGAIAADRATAVNDPLHGARDTPGRAACVLL